MYAQGNPVDKKELHLCIDLQPAPTNNTDKISAHISAHVGCVCHFRKAHINL